MSNPLLKGAENSFGGGDIPPGETRIVHARDKQGNIIKTIEILRTERDYVYDLCDAYNNARTPAALAHGAEWFVTPAGELKLGDDAVWSRFHAKQIATRTESERARFNRHQLENARLND